MLGIYAGDESTIRERLVEQGQVLLAQSIFININRSDIITIDVEWEDGGRAEYVELLFFFGQESMDFTEIRELDFVGFLVFFDEERFESNARAKEFHVVVNTR